jgi:hypothetical protein
VDWSAYKTGHSAAVRHHRHSRSATAATPGLCCYIFMWFHFACSAMQYSYQWHGVVLLLPFEAMKLHIL